MCTVVSVNVMPWLSAGMVSETQAESMQNITTLLTTFQTKVLMRLDQLLENQQEMINLLRSAGSLPRDSIDPLPRPCEDVEALTSLCHRLTDEGFKKQMVSILALDGSKTVGKTVRRMLGQLGTNRLWSEYSMKGRRKASFSELPLLRLITKKQRRAGATGAGAGAEGLRRSFTRRPG